MPSAAASACAEQRVAGCSADLCSVEAVSQDLRGAPGEQQRQEVELQSEVSHGQQLHRPCLDRLRRLLHDTPQRPVPRQYLDDCTRMRMPQIRLQRRLGLQGDNFPQWGASLVQS